MPIRVITFDWGDTLAANHGMPHRRLQRAALTRLAEDLSAVGGTADGAWVDAVMDAIGVGWRDTVDVTKNPDHREMDLPGILSAAVARAGGLDLDPHAVARAVARCGDAMTDTVKPYGHTAGVLALLHARGYRMGILSHVAWAGDACRNWFRRHDLDGYFSFYSLSSEVGWIKPNPRHYQHALDQAGVSPAEVLHVGDHPKRDVEGGRRFGFRTCLILTEGIYPEADLDGCQPDAAIGDLRQLPAVIAGLDGRG